MRGAAALVAAAFLITPAAAQSFEALRLSADAGLSRSLLEAAHPDLEGAKEPVLQPPLEPRPANPLHAKGVIVGKIALPVLISANRHILTRQFGARTLDLGIVSNAAFSEKFFTFTDPKTTTLAPLGDMNRLRGDGVDARIDARTVYNFKVVVNIFSPVRGSTLKMTPIQGTDGPKHEMKTGALLDAIRAKSYVFKAKDQELWLSYDADVLPDGSGFADTRSFLFTKQDGLSSKAWPLAEAKLPVDTGVTVDLGGIGLTLTRTSSGELVIRE